MNLNSIDEIALLKILITFDCKSWQEIKQCIGIKKKNSLQKFFLII